MKHTILSIFLLTILSIQIVSAQKIKISSDFDRGSIGPLKQVSENEFRGQTIHCIKNDMVGNTFYWFYFKIENVKHKTITFQLDNLQGIYRSSYCEQYNDTTQPVISYDNKQWERISNVKYNKAKKSFSFTVDFKKNKAWIAYAHPYPYQMAVKYMESIEKSEFTKVIDQKYSPGGRALKLLEITNPETSDKDKKKVMITALQHAGEDYGGYFTEGMINFLVSDDPEAKKIRDKFTFYIVPVMNPDGLYQGQTRYNINMEDLNSEWDDDISDTLNLPVEPEVKFIKDWLAGFDQSTKKLDLFMDIHSQSQYYPNNGIIASNEKIKDLTQIISKYWPVKYYPGEEQFTGSAAGFFSHKYHIPTGTLEMTQSYDQKNGYLTIDNYRSYGQDFIKAIEELLQTTINK